jgi:hypothetical protein
MNARAILSNGRTVKENGGGAVCIQFFIPFETENMVNKQFNEAEPFLRS